MRQPSAIRHQYHRTLGLPPRQLLLIQVRIICRQPPGDASRNQATLTGRRGIRQDSLVPPSDSSEPVQSINSFVTAAMLRTNNVPWQVSPARPAILLSDTNLLAGFQNLTLQSLSTSEEVNDIHCVFCLAEDGDHAKECVILRCGQCRALSHLACAEEWLEWRRVGSGTSCCVW
jgi:hypothetical protein